MSVVGDGVVRVSRGRTLRIVASVLVCVALLLWGPLAFGISMSPEDGSDSLTNDHAGPALLLLGAVELSALAALLVSYAWARRPARVGLVFGALSVTLAGGLLGVVAVGVLVG